MAYYYILKGKKPIPVDDSLVWAEQFEKTNRVVRIDWIENPDILISTVFLGINHCFNGGEPILFETMIFGGKFDGYQKRYFTWEQAEEGHLKALEMVLKGENLKLTDKNEEK